MTERQAGLFRYHARPLACSVDDEPDTADWTPERRTRYQEMAAAFWLFHMRNPAVYDELRAIALALVDRGRSRYGIGGLFEVLRWQRAMNTTDVDFKLNNNYRAFYARMLMRHEPELAGFFELREQISDRS